MAVLEAFVFSLLFLGGVQGQDPIQLSAVPFDLANVRLSQGSLFETMQERNLDFLVGLNSTTLLCVYTAAANLTGTLANPTCQFLDQQAYAGHYQGHWLSATALAWASTGNTTVRDKSAAVVAQIALCQQAWTGIGHQGYVFPYDPIVFWTLEQDPPANCAPVCVPFYILHKMLAGLLDQYVLVGNEQALQIAIDLGYWVNQNVESVLVRGGEGLWQTVLGVEWGGMNEALYNLFSITGNYDFLTTAYYFNHFVWTAPLAVDIDDLGGNHANTHIPEVIGDSRGYELTGNKTQRNIVENFFNFLNGSHTFATGGSNDHEYWNPPNQLGDQMDSDTEESCTTYNILKLARNLYEWSANSTLFDFYERALFNGLIGNQNRLSPYDESTHATGFIYFLPLGGAGLQKQWGASNVAFPCCWGTLSEVFAKLGDSIYFRSTDNTTLYINLFASSTAEWPELGLTVTQDAAFPASLESTTVVTVSTAAATPVKFAMNVRVPLWAINDNKVLINGQPFTGAIVPGTYLSISRSWSNGDVVSVYYPPSLRFEQLNDYRPQWQGVGAIMYGAILLAGVAYTDRLPINPAKLDSFLQRNSTTELTFVAQSDCGTIGFIPLYQVTFESYSVYFHTNLSAGVVGYNASGYSVLPGGPVQLDVSGGASTVSNGADINIRTGDPGQISTVRYNSIVEDASHFVTGVAFQYRYVSGYGPAGRHQGANFSLFVLDECNELLDVPLYQSPELTQYPYDECNTCYSPPVVVKISDLNITVSTAKSFGFVFQNNDRNLQLLLPLDLTISWD